MSVVDNASSKVLDLDRGAAERRAERIRLRLDTIADNYAAVMPMIRESIEKRDDLALGYPSVGAYVADRFGGSLQRLGVEVRRAVVGELTAAGMSTRAIAPVVGVSQKTVDRDVRQVSHVTQLSETPVGEGDSASGADDPAPTEATSGVNRPQDYPTAPAPAPRPPVTGIDGKTYPRPAAREKPIPGEPRQRPRRALPDVFFDVAFDLTKITDRLTRLADDDRFPQNAEKVAAKHRDDLLRARDALDGVLARMP